MNDLSNFIADVEKESPFVRFEDGEPVVGVYQGAKVVDDTFNKGEQTMEYTLDVDGVKKTFKSRSVKLARLVSQVKEGDKVEIVKTGTGFDTLWYADKVTNKAK